MKAGSFPFKYLGAQISPLRLSVNHFHCLTYRANRVVASWNRTKMSYDGKQVLINSVMLSIPKYFLSFSVVPDSIIDNISKKARNFLWSNCGNRKGIHSIPWDYITQDKSDGGLGIHNLRNVKTALMAKNVFYLLNGDEKYWVGIWALKYGNFNVWNLNPIPNSSAFHKAFYKSAKII